MTEHLIKVRAKTGAKRESLTVVNESTLVIEVKDKPERNLANKRIVELLAAHLNISTSKIRIIKGHRTPSKTLSIFSE